MSTTWTSEQLAAITSRGENLLLSAAAGSGKTTVLVERVIRLIEEGCPVDRMLVVTFTRASAADMRQSLIGRLTERAESDPAFREQAERAERAQISTIHSFCSNLLRAHFQAAGIDPMFRVSDSSEPVILRQKALDEALREAYERFSPDMRLLDAGRDPEAIRMMALSLHSFLMEQAEPWAWLDEAVHSAEAGDGEWANALAAAARRKLNEALSYVRFARGLSLHAKYEQCCTSDEEYICTLASLDYAGLHDALAKPAFMRLPTLRGDDREDESNALFRLLRDGYKDLVKSAKDPVALSPAGALEDVMTQSGALRALGAIVRRMDSRFGELKAERSILTFTDLEHLSLKVLRDDEIARSVRAEFDYVFVDEYQDVSRVQEAILARVSRADNRFMVGDVKQSIYRFRQAEPRLFLQKYSDYMRGQNGRMIALTQNFRSRAAVLSFTNAVFERAMAGEGAEVVYDDDARLRPGARYEGDDPPVEITVVNQSGEDDESASGEDEQLIAELSQVEAEATLAAGRIHELLGTPIYDAKRAAYRPTRCRDIVILVRQAKDVAGSVVDTLGRHGIPAYADLSGGYFAVVEVRVVLELMRLLENQRLDLAWISVLRSPIGGLSAAQLAEIRISSPEGTFAEAVSGYAKEQDDDIARAISNVIALLDSWRPLIGLVPLEELTWHLLSDSGFYDYVGAMPGGTQRQANLDVLLSRVATYDAMQLGGLTGFLQQVDQMTAAKEDMGEAHTLSENDDVVRVMTVHKSKGLEFPVVFGLLLGRAFRGAVPRSRMTMHKDLGVGFAHVDPALNTQRDTLVRLAAADRLQQEALWEELRVLYVLFTRAKDRLLLYGTVKNAAREALRWQISTESMLPPRSFLDVIAAALPAMAQLGGASSALATVNWVNASSIRAGERRQTTTAVEAFDQLCAQAPDPALAQSLSWRYPHEAAVYLPVKMTASGLNREITGPVQPPPLADQPVFAAGEQLTGAQRGTAVHDALQFLEYAPLRGLEDDDLLAAIDVQLDAFVRHGQLTQIARDNVPAALLANFLHTEIGQRISHAQVLHREWMFTLRIGVREALGIDSDESMLVQGSIDCCFEEDDGWVLLDYKTDRTDDMAALAARYRPQLSLYAAALTKLTGKPVRQQALCVLRAGQVLYL